MKAPSEQSTNSWEAKPASHTKLYDDFSIQLHIPIIIIYISGIIFNFAFESLKVNK